MFRLTEALKAVFNNQPFVYMITPDKNIAVAPARKYMPPDMDRSGTVSLPPIQVNGKVLDATSGEPIRRSDGDVQGEPGWDSNK